MGPEQRGGLGGHETNRGGGSRSDLAVRSTVCGVEVLNH